MPNISSIVLTDGVTPITLTPVGGDAQAGQTRYRSTSGATLEANPELLFSSKFNPQSKVQRQYAKLVHPLTTLSADTGDTTVRDVIIVEVNVRVPSSATPDERALAVNRAFSMVDSGALNVELTTGEGQW